MNSLGQRIRELRIKQGLTQIDLAKGVCTPSMISQIESDRARPSYKILFAIAEKLQVPLEKLLVDVDMNLEYISTYKMARAMVAAKEYAPAVPLLRELLATPRPQISTAEIMFDLAVCCLHTGELEQAHKLLTDVQDLTILRQDHHMLAHVLLHIGAVELSRKRYQLAAYQCQKGLEEADKLEDQDDDLRANLLFYLGLANVKLGQVQEGLAYYRQAATLYEQSDNRNEIGRVYMGLGHSYKKLNDLEQAQAYAELAQAIFDSQGNVQMTVKLNVLRAMIYGQTGQVNLALQLLREAITQFYELNNREEEGKAYVELAKLLLQDGQVDAAEEACRHARVLLPELHLYHAWVNRLLGRIALLRNQREEAVRRLQSAAECFKRMEEVGEWDHTMFELVQLYFADNNLELAFDTLEEMRRYGRLVLEERGIVL